MPSDSSPGFATLGIHAGSHDAAQDEPVAPSIVRSSTFVGGPDGEASPLYGRYGNSPTHQLLCTKLAALEGA